MSKGTTSYRIKDENALYFLTISTVEWIDVFTSRAYRDILLDSLAYCQKEKGLILSSWCVMSNHVHMIARADEGYKLSGFSINTYPVIPAPHRLTFIHKCSFSKVFMYWLGSTAMAIVHSTPGQFFYQFHHQFFLFIRKLADING